MTHEKNVCMFVYNNFLNDSRVKKEAQTLIKAGYQVTVVALLDTKTTPIEEKNQLRIIRVPIDPWHLRLFRRLQNIGVSDLFSFLQDRFQQAKIDRNTNSSDGFSGRVIDATKFRAIAHFILDKIPVKKTIKAIFFLVLAYALFELFFFSELLDWIHANKLLSFCTLGATIMVLYKLKGSMKYIYRLLNHIKRFALNSLKHFLMPFHRQFCFFSFYKNAYQSLKSKNFGIFHAHDLNTLPVAYYSAKKKNAKLVYDSHELYIERNKLKPSSRIWKFILRRIEGFLIKKTDGVFTVNESIADEMAKRYKIEKPGVVMNTPTSFNTVAQDTCFIGKLRSELSVPAHYQLILYIGAITFNRGLEELIQSLQYLPDCYLAYMGYGNDQFKQTLLDLVERTDVADRFSFFGPVPPEQVIHYAADADLGVAPIANACLSYYCCSPNKLFEYMNAGLPVVSSNFPELEKVVIGHQIGKTFAPDDPRDIARSIREILDDPASRERMAKNAIEASKLYNWENESQKLLQIYARL